MNHTQGHSIKGTTGALKGVGESEYNQNPLDEILKSIKTYFKIKARHSA